MKKCRTCPRSLLDNYKICDNCYQSWLSERRMIRKFVLDKYEAAGMITAPGMVNHEAEETIAILIKMYEEDQIDQYELEVAELNKRFAK